MSHLNIAFNQYASSGTVMHYILVMIVQDRTTDNLVTLIGLLEEEAG